VGNTGAITVIHEPVSLHTHIGF